MKRWIVLSSFGIVLMVLGMPLKTFGGTFEISGSFSYSQTNFGGTSTQWSRRWSASAGYTFWERSEVEFSVQDVLYRTLIDNTEDTTFHDQIYSLNWVQSFTGRKAVFQPYLKLGAGQLNRDASGTQRGGTIPPAQYDVLTVILGAGFRIFVLESLALRVEANSYLPGGVLSFWSQNFSFNGGLSVYF